jgi:hypothetical protein
MVSGLYPPQHGVHNFSGTFDSDITTIFDLVTGEVPCYMGVSPLINSITNAVHYNHLYDFFDAVREIEPPFLVFDRELITHGPYGFDTSGAHLDDSEREFQNSTEYWRARENDPEQIYRDYETGAKLATERFEERLELLRERDLLESTLIIFTADHGEVVGEYGLYGHAPMITPESVYVPTVFYNDSITVDGDFMGHIDLLPTLASLVDTSIQSDLPGYDLFEGAPEDRLLFNMRRYHDSLLYGGWDKYGGHTFFEGSNLARLRYALGQLIRGPQSVIHRRQPLKTVYHTLRRDRQFGNPAYDREEVQAFCKEILATTAEEQQTELGEETKKRLRDLGYVDEDIK